VTHSAGFRANLWQAKAHTRANSRDNDMRHLTVVAALLAMLLTACSNGDSNIVITSQTVGATGGTVSAPSGSGIAGASVAIPAGALTADATVTVKSGSTAGTAITGFNVVGPVVEITVKNSSGGDVTLGAAATVTIPYDVGQAGTGTVILYKQSGLAAPEVVAGATASGGNVTAQITSFSRFWAMIQAAVNPGTLTITSVVPPTGPAAGGTAVVITGTGFSTTGTTTVSFGGAAATNVSVLSATSISCTTPAGANGPVSVSVTSGGNNGSLVAGFLYNSVVVLTVTSVSPNSGPEAGGTAVTITGAGFNTGSGSLTRMVNVSFGIGLTALASNVVVVNDTTITCTTPAGTAGAVIVGIAINDLATPLAAGGLPNGFTYTTGGGTQMSLTSVSPNSGTALGGTTVTVTGANFPTTGQFVVTFGGTAATNVVVSSTTELSCVTPAGTAGAVNVVLTVGTETATLTNGFTYTAATVTEFGTWAKQSTTNAPTARFGHGMVQVNGTVYVWGGRSFATNPQASADGASYNHTTDTWTALSTTNAPSGRYWHQMVSADSKFYVFGGDRDTQPGQAPDAKIYDSVAGTWSNMSMTDAPANCDASVVEGFLGPRIFVWGRNAQNVQNLYIYTITNDTWTLANSQHGLPGTTSFGQYILAWTGTKVIVFSGSTGQGALYDPTANSWAAMSSTNGPGTRNLPAMGFRNTHFIVWGGDINSSIGGKMYEVATDTWTDMSTVNAPDPGNRSEVTVVTTGSGLFLWGGSYGSVTGVTRANNGWWFIPDTNTWEKATVDFTNQPSGRSDAKGVYVGKVIIFGGSAAAGAVGVGSNLTR